MIQSHSRKNAARSTLFPALALACAVALGGGMLAAPVYAQGGQVTSPAGLRVDALTIVKQDGLRESFSVEIAETPKTVQDGLMHRTEMARDAGMLFYFGSGEREVAFWMKNTLIPLDMIFIRADGTIANIHENAVPMSLQSVPSRAPVLAVLELNGGEAAARGIQVGDRVDHPYFRAQHITPVPQIEKRPALDGEVSLPKSVEERAQRDAETAPLPQPEIETPELLDRSRIRGIDADLQQR
jgi:uncharacterized membrane protein (UPF0127 family)